MVTEVLNGGITVEEKTQQSANAPTNKIALYFDVIQEHTVSMQNQITDNFVENNTAIQDHIAQSPLQITLRGLSGEVVYIPSGDKLLNQAYDKINVKLGNSNLKTEKMHILPALLPPVDNATQMAKNAVNYIEASYRRYEKIIKNFKNPLDKNLRLKTIYRDLSILRESNTALIVTTPYETFDNMYIQSLVLRQGNENYVTDIELTLKQIKFTETETTGVDKETMAKLNAGCRAKPEDHGLARGKTVSVAKLIYHI